MFWKFLLKQSLKAYLIFPLLSPSVVPLVLYTFSPWDITSYYLHHHTDYWPPHSDHLLASFFATSCHKRINLRRRKQSTFAFQTQMCIEMHRANICLTYPLLQWPSKLNLSYFCINSTFDSGPSYCLMELGSSIGELPSKVKCLQHRSARWISGFMWVR